MRIDLGSRRGVSAFVALAALIVLLSGCAARTAGSAGACAPPCPAPCEAPCPEPCPAPCPAPVAAGPCPEPCAPLGPPPCPPGGENRSGEVWCRVWIPAVTSTCCEQVCVKPATTRKIWIPPQYGTRPKLCCVEDARLDEHVLKPVWTAQQRDVLLTPEREYWRRVCCPPVEPPGPCGPTPQECWQKQCCPPVWGKECVPVCVAPERYCVEYTPAKYKLVEERYMIAPGRCETICEPAEYQTVCREVCVCPGRWEWKRNASCEVPAPAPLPALQVEMKDSSVSGSEEGTFKVGEIARYDLEISGDGATADIPGLKVVFTLPKELEFVSGGGPGVTVRGAGQSAESTSFVLPKAGSVRMQVLTRVKAAPTTNLVQFAASIVSSDGVELTNESESTTVSRD